MAGAALLLGSPASPSVLVAPHALFLDDDEPSAVLYVHNDGDQPQEIQVQLRFGYPVSDENGDMHVRLDENPGPDEPSAAGWVRALPRRFLLQPGERQAIRLLATPPVDLHPGEYWSRVLVSSLEAGPSVAVAGSADVQASLTLETRTILSLVYRKGSVTTGVVVREFTAGADSSGAFADVRLERTGDAAYLGRLLIDLTDGRGRPVASWHRAVAVYRDLYRRAVLPVDLSTGVYTMTLRIDTEREDIPGEEVLHFPPVIDRLTVTVP